MHSAPSSHPHSFHNPDRVEPSLYPTSFRHPPPLLVLSHSSLYTVTPHLKHFLDTKISSSFHPMASTEKDAHSRPHRPMDNRTKLKSQSNSSKLVRVNPSMISKQRVRDGSPSVIDRIKANLYSASRPPLRPSEYARMLSLSTTDALVSHDTTLVPSKIVQRMNRFDGQKVVTSTVPDDQPLFCPTPAEITLQNYRPFQTYEVVLTFRNADASPRWMRVEPIDHPCFNILGWKTESLQSGRIAAGMDVAYILQFTPEEERDYNLNVVCETERERFLIPVRAVGSRAILDLPDQILFGNSAVKHITTTTILAKNMGKRRAKIAMKVDPPFAISQNTALIEADKSIQLELTFKPESVGSYSRDLIINFDNGDEIAVQLIGIADDVNIYLDRSEVRLDNTFLTRVSYKKIKIYNNSDIVADFQWKRFSSPADEQTYRQRQKHSLDQLEVEESLLFSVNKVDGLPTSANDRLLLAQKFERKRQLVEQDNLGFTNEAFLIEPISGRVWPKSHIDVSIGFKPSIAGPQSTIVFCEVSGRETRLPLQLKGEATGPKAKLSYDMLNMDDIFVKSSHVYEVILENIGHIDAEYHVTTLSTLFGSKFGFSPDRGILAGGQKEVIQITFQSDILGDFYEEFIWNIKGAPTPLQLAFSGRVIGPTFHFNVSEIEFGECAYGFHVQRMFDLVNTSPISMSYQFHMDEDSGDSKQFSIIPRRGEVGPMSTQVVEVHFMPSATKQYNTRLNIDVENVGLAVSSIAVKALGTVPEIQLETPFVDLAECYLNVTYKKQIVLSNNTDLPAKYSVIQQSGSSQLLYNFQVDEPSGVLEPQSTKSIALDFITKSLGESKCGITIQILGMEDYPLSVEVTCNGVGPNISPSVTELDWGKISVLKNHSMRMTLRNDSPIPADFRLTLASDQTVFAVEPSRGILLPYQTAEITVNAFLDDAQRVVDILKVLVKSGPTREITLLASGKGSTIVFDDDVTHIDFRNVFTHQFLCREFTMTNKGRKSQLISWASSENLYILKAGENNQTKAVSYFEVTPSRFVLNSGEKQIVTIKGFSGVARHHQEKLVCQGTVEKDSIRRQIVESHISANFIDPKIEVVPSVLNFTCAFVDEKQLPLIQTLTLKNVTPLSFSVQLRCHQPFQILNESSDIAFEPEKEIKIPVQFDPSLLLKDPSMKGKSKLLISYMGHPQRSYIDLKSHVSFPEIRLEKLEVDFGWAPPNVKICSSCSITNISDLQLSYSWYFLSDEINIETQDTEEQTFDILPSLGILAPGETQTLQLTFHSGKNGRYRRKAICDVLNGPKYTLTLQGGTSAVGYDLSSQELDFGSQQYQTVAEKTLALSNNGTITLQYSIVIPRNSDLFHKVLISPPNGNILPGNKQIFKVWYAPCIPEVTDAYFYIVMKYLEPIEVKIRGKGFAPFLAINLPLETNEPPKITKLVTGSKDISKRVPLEGNHTDTDVFEPHILTEEQTIEDGNTKLIAMTKAHISGLNLKMHYSHKHTSNYVGSRLILDALTQQIEDSQRNLIINLSAIQLATYTINFGFVTSDTVLTKEFTIQNITNSSLTISPVKNLNSALTINAEKIKFLQPMETMNIQVSLDTSKIPVDNCYFQADIPFSITGGPTSVVKVSAIVTLPNLSVSVSDIDFGNVLCGHRKAMNIYIQNSSAVPCDWNTMLLAQGPDTADRKRPKRKYSCDFEIIPNMGYLKPGEKMILTVRFTPSMSKNYQFCLAFHVKSNTRPITLPVYGNGDKLDLLFEPEVLDMGSILPWTDGTECKVKLHNPSDYQIEVFCADFDLQYHKEQEILAELAKSGEKIITLPPRQPGQKMVGIFNFTKDKANKDGISSGEVFENVSKTEEEVKLPLESNEQNQLIVVLYGPPYSGKSSIANMLAQKYGLCILKFDQVIDILMSSVDSNHQTLVSKMKDVFHTDLDLQLQLTSSGKLSSAGETESRTTVTESVGEPNEHVSSIPDEAIAEILRLCLAKPEFKTGVIIDGLDSKLCRNQVTFMKGLLRVLSEKRTCHFVHITLDPSQVCNREAEFKKQLYEVELSKLPPVEVISEETYDSMSEMDGYHYDERVKNHRKQLQHFQHQKLLEKKQLEEDIIARLGERKLEEEKSKKKDKRKLTTKTNSDKQDKSSQSLISPGRSVKTNSIERIGSHHKMKFDEIIMKPEILNELPPEIMLSEAAYRQYEVYKSSLEAVINYAKEGVRSIPTKSAVTSDKKKLRGYLSSDSTSSNLSHPLNEVESSGDENFIHFYEVNGVKQKELLFHYIADLISISPKPDLNEETALPLDVPTVEQIISLDQCHANYSEQSRKFTIVGTKSPLTLHESTSVLNDTNQNLQSLRSDHILKKTKVVGKQDDADHSDNTPKEQFSSHRWIIDPRSRREVAVKFSTNEVGKFEETIQFGVLSMNTLFPLKCHGESTYPQILMDHKKVFKKYRWDTVGQQLIKGEYIGKLSLFDFGPLVINKFKDKMVDKAADNVAELRLTNPMDSDIKLSFGFLHDLKSEYLGVEPLSVDIRRGETQSIHVQIFPKVVGLLEDTLVCCIKDNPQPYTFKFRCIGVRPEIEIDKKTLSFERILVNKTDKKEIKLRNTTLIPILWRLSGIENLGEEIEITPSDGAILPNEECIVVTKFLALKPCLIKKGLRLEVVDSEKSNAVMQTETITITAEVYDVSVDIIFPKGNDNILDFGIIQAIEESKQTIYLKNKGKYDISYKFTFETKEFLNIFEIVPSQGILQPSDKSHPVQITYKPGREIEYESAPILRCLLVDTNSESTTNDIPIKVSIKAVFSQFTILPVRDLNFGPILNSTKATKSFIIENTGDFEFNISIFKIETEQVGAKDLKHKLMQGKGPKDTKGRNDKPSPQLSVKATKKDQIKQADAVIFGPFTVFPTNVTVTPGSKQQITVEFHPESSGSYAELIAIDVSDHNPKEMDVIEYHLLGESCIPEINTSDFLSIFEEHTVTKRLELSYMHGNVYAEDDRVFFFGAHVVGQQVQARFKISNPLKISCEVSLSVKPRMRMTAQDFAFEIEPKKMILLSHEAQYATVTFHPSSIQSYTGVFEAIVENSSEAQPCMLTFDLRGEGTLPRVSVEFPNEQNKQDLLMKFKRTLVGKSRTLPLLVRNDGIIPAKFTVEWSGGVPNAFLCEGLNRCLSLNPQESHTYHFEYKPLNSGKMEADVQLKIIDNMFESSTFRLIGEGYMDYITFDELPDDTGNEINFGDCMMGELKEKHFTITNHCKETVKFSWEKLSDFIFAPSDGTIEPCQSKMILVRFQAKQPIVLQSVIARCKLNSSSVNGIAVADKMQNDQSLQSKSITEGNLRSQIFDEKGLEKSLILSAFSDHSSFLCEISNINFKTTLMFQSRIYQFQIQNTGKVKLQFSAHFSPPRHEDTPPFKVEPQNGIIQPKEFCTFTVKFTPMDAIDYTAQLNVDIPNLVSHQKSIVIEVKGSAVKPLCHFELEESDYLSGDRRTLENQLLANGQQVDLQTRVIEFTACGINIQNVKRFYIMNPTDTSYEFEWTRIDMGDTSKMFKCLTPKGIVVGGKKFELAFEYFPTATEIVESLWQFHIPSHKITVPFLLVGQATEPSIYIDKPNIHFKPVLVGKQAKETVRLINNELMPFSFSLNEPSLKTRNGTKSALQFSPVSGTIEPKSEVSVDIIFQPATERVFNYSLMCNIKRKSNPVAINIKGEGYIIHEVLQTEGVNGDLSPLIPNSGENLIEFGHVSIGENTIKRIIIQNNGKFMFDFVWKISDNAKQVVAVKPDKGTVGRKEQMICEMIYSPVNTQSLHNVTAICHITNGNYYETRILGNGVKPHLKFSNYIHDFGLCFLHQSGVKPPSTIFEIRNDEVKHISFDLTSSCQKVFEIDQSSITLAPNTTVAIPINFYPMEIRKYSGTITALVNKLTKFDFQVMGEGTPLKIDLLNVPSSMLNLGAVRPGQISKRAVKLINRSAIPVTFSIGSAAKLEKLKSLNITLDPSTNITLQPKSICKVAVIFEPKQRVPSFVEEVTLNSRGKSQPLFSIMGVCHGIGVSLESEIVPFGSVITQSSTTKRIQLHNTGDVGVRFKWDDQAFATDFTIFPTEGYISPNMAVSLQITFHPTKICPDIRYENIECTVEGAASVFLTLTGSCIPVPGPVDTLRFSVPVRQSEVKSISLINRGTNVWCIKPIIDNKFWSGADMIIVEPGVSKSYDITFHPMTTVGLGEGGRHEGIIFFPLPDGGGISYKLLGVAEKAIASGNISREIACKTVWVESISVTNWLMKSQRFKVQIEQARPDPTVNLKGHDYLDIAGCATSEYRLTIYAYKECVVNGKITFLNETTGEYLFHTFCFKTTPPGTIGYIDFSTTVRQSITKEIVLQNPLSFPVSFTSMCSSPEITLVSGFIIQPKSDYTLPIEFLPLHPKDTTSQISLISNDLGSYQYDLKLFASPPGPERALHFKVGLGGSQIQTFRFVNMCKSKAEFNCKVESSEFTVERSQITVGGNTEVCIEITYEPSILGSTRGYLLVTSSLAGDYYCPLHGYCLAPAPQGPITIKPGAVVSIPFKNIFNQAATFGISVDSPVFSVKSSETIGPKKTINIGVGCKQNTSGEKDKQNYIKSGDMTAAKTAKLTVSHSSGISWIYYLKGTT
ncbi:hypothetical protein BKA69DRAFT_1166800 [Paraphysoderma sedebokerense]|nr:hypothetical protein BKA69DRAFT_1166800 [Paraphysoderma sedebokerense]